MTLIEDRAKIRGSRYGMDNGYESLDVIVEVLLRSS